MLRRAGLVVLVLLAFTAAAVRLSAWTSDGRWTPYATVRRHNPFARLGDRVAAQVDRAWKRALGRKRGTVVYRVH
jgi:hypothetical protein